MARHRAQAAVTPPPAPRIKQDIGVMADRVLQGDVVEADLSDGTFGLLMDELKRRGYGLVKRSEVENHLQPFIFRVKEL
jgi:hypothetical protein